MPMLPVEVYSSLLYFRATSGQHWIYPACPLAFYSTQILWILALSGGHGASFHWRAGAGRWG
jgi:hypothetical protein